MTSARSSSRSDRRLPAWTAVVRRHRFIVLFFALLTFFALMPMIDELHESEFPFVPHVLRLVVFLGVLTTVVVSISRTRIGKSITLAIALTAIALWLLPEASINVRTQIARHILAIGFIGYSIVGILMLIFRSSRVNFNLLCAALCVYLLIGIGWSIGYSLMTTVNPASFFSNVPGQPPAVAMRIGDGKSMEAVYFSFATLTTLGYGDIVPLSPVARLFTVFEAVIGQLFLTVLIAQLVAMHVVHLQSRRNVTGP